MTQPQPAPSISNEFDAAKQIVEVMKGLDKQQQLRAMRFASESLDIQTPPAPTPSPAQPPVPTPTPPPPRQMDIKQFTEAKAPKSDQQFATVAAYYYRFEAPLADRKDSIGIADLMEAARLAQRKRPGKFALNNAKNSGYLDPAERGKFRISTVGENLVAVTLPGNASEGAPRRAPERRKPKSKSKAPKKASRSRE